MSKYLITVAMADKCGYVYSRSFMSERADDFTVNACKSILKENSCGEFLYDTRGSVDVVDLDKYVANFEADTKLLQKVEELAEDELEKSKAEKEMYLKLKDKYGIEV
jgi:hypothetical protein